MSKSATRPGNPNWLKQWNEIRVNGEVIERFKRRAPSAERILDAFEEDEWDVRIDDPLKPIPGHSEKQRAARLRSQVEALKKRLKSGLLTFEMDGSGSGVRWHWT